MKKLLKLTLCFAVVSIFACKGNQNSSQNSATDSTKVVTDTTKSATIYTCPMHPEVVSDTAGTCPTCGMALEPKS